MNTVRLDKYLIAAEKLYGVFPFGVLERPRKFDDISEIKYLKLQLRLLFLCFNGRKLDDKNARKLGGY